MAKVYRNGLKSRGFELGGVHRSGWWAPLFCVLGYRCEYGDWGISDTIWRNLGLLPKSMVLPNCIGVTQNCLKMLLEFVIDDERADTITGWCRVISGSFSHFKI
ncbi:MAG: hypothetical protein NC225_09825 [Clostridium sp.]|nr:hypothetical protein [Clostridium sp.]